MKSSEYKKEIETLLLKSPKPTAIESIQAVTKFKEAVSKAKKASSLEKLQSAYNQLKGFYE